MLRGCGSQNRHRINELFPLQMECPPHSQTSQQKVIFMMTSVANKCKCVIGQDGRWARWEEKTDHKPIIHQEKSGDKKVTSKTSVRHATTSHHQHHHKHQYYSLSIDPRLPISTSGLTIAVPFCVTPAEVATLTSLPVVLPIVMVTPGFVAMVVAADVTVVFCNITSYYQVIYHLYLKTTK